MTDEEYMAHEAKQHMRGEPLYSKVLGEYIAPDSLRDAINSYKQSRYADIDMNDIAEKLQLFTCIPVPVPKLDAEAIIEQIGGYSLLSDTAIKDRHIEEAVLRAKKCLDDLFDDIRGAPIGWIFTDKRAVFEDEKDA